MNAAPRGSDYFGQLLRQHRLRASLSQEELAARSQLSAKGIAVLERGKRRTPRPSTVALLADGLGLVADERAIFIAAANGERLMPELAPGVAQSRLSVHARTLPACRYPFLSPARLVGRAAELAFFENTLAKGCSSGQVVMLGGAAGAGKSALLGEVVRRAEAQGTLCLAGAAYEQTGVVPLGPFWEALTAYLLAQPRDEARAVLGSTAADLAAVVPELRYHLGLEDAVVDRRPADPARLFAAVHRFLRTLAERGPMLLCVEDLHAADLASQQLFGYLVRQLTYTSQHLPLVLIGTYRPECVAGSDELESLIARVRRDRACVLMTLQLLDRAATSELAESVLGAPVSERLIDWLQETAAGNALFAHQLVLSVSEEGRLVQRGGVWHERSHAPPEIPAIIRELIAQRVGRLTSECRATLEVCAVMGPRFDYEVLAAVRPDRADGGLDEDLDEALRTQLLHETVDGYAFAHAVVREVIYTGLTPARRASIHGRIGRALEERPDMRPVDHVAALAHHFMRAPRSPATREKAIEYSLAAALQTAAMSAYREALTHYRNVCEALEPAADIDANPDERLVAALEGCGRAEREVGQWRECIASNRRVLALTADPLRRARARAVITAALIHMGNITEALAETEAGLADIGDASSQEAVSDRLYLMTLLAMLRYLQGRYGEIVEFAHEMRAAADSMGRPREQMMAHSATAWAYMGRGDVSTALYHYRHALAAAERSGDKILVATSLENLALQHYIAGDFTEARVQFERALGLHRAWSGELRTANGVQQLCRICVAEGELGPAYNRVLEVLDLELVGQDRLAGDGYHVLGVIESLRGNRVAATEWLTQALAIRERANDLGGIIESSIALGVVCEQAEDSTAARRAFTNAVEVGSRMDAGLARASAHRALGRFLLHMGECDAARMEIQRASELAVAMPETLEYAAVQLAVAELYASEGKLEAALAAAEAGLGLPQPLDQQIETHILLARVSHALGNVERAREHAEWALAAAERMGAPRLRAAAAAAARAVAAGAEPVVAVGAELTAPPLIGGVDGALVAKEESGR